MSTKKILYILLLSPFVFSLLFAINYIRDKRDVEGSESNSMVVSFFLQQSVSMNVVACTYDEIESLPKNKLYSLGPLFDYVRNNYLSRIIFGTKPYKVGSAELVEKGHSLDSAITSIVLPYSFSVGKGMGSSFVAEAWYDFGYLGIVIYSILYGFILCAIPRLCSKNVWWGVIGLVFLKYILYSPRARTTTFLSQALSVSFWPLALVIHLISLTKPNY